MTRQRNPILSFVAVALLMLATGTLDAAEERSEATQAVIEVSYSNGSFSLTARDASLADVLYAIGDEVGFETRLSGDLSEPVNFSFENAALVPALRWLVGQHSLKMIRYPTAAGRSGPLAEIDVMAAAGFGIGPEPTLAEIQSALRVLSNALESPDQTSPARRIAAFDKLARSGNAEAITMLERFAAREEDEIILGHAIEALGHIDGQAATLSLGRIVIGNPDPEARRLATLALSLRRTTAARAFLESAANDEDDTVRREAEYALGRR
jgi:hypothetical protein